MDCLALLAPFQGLNDSLVSTQGVALCCCFCPVGAEFDGNLKAKQFAKNTMDTIKRSPPLQKGGGGGGSEKH